MGDCFETDLYVKITRDETDNDTVTLGYILKGVVEYACPTETLIGRMFQSPTNGYLPKSRKLQTSCVRRGGSLSERFRCSTAKIMMWLQ